MQVLTAMIEDLPLVKTATTIGVAAATVPNAVPADPVSIVLAPVGLIPTAMSFFWQMMSMVDVYNWRDVSGFFGGWLAILGIFFLLWRSVFKPLFQKFGWVKRSPRIKVDVTESEYQRLRDMR